MIEDDNHWVRVGSREVYRNPWIRVREDQVIRPDGEPGIYGIVEFQNLALGIVPVTSDMQTILVGQYRYALSEYSWEIPEGGGRLGVDPLIEAKRELEEESGATSDSWVDLGRFHLSNSVTNEEGRIYLAQNVSLGTARPDGDEVLRQRILPVSEAYRMCIDGRITDAVSIIGIMRAVAYFAS